MNLLWTCLDDFVQDLFLLYRKLYVLSLVSNIDWIWIFFFMIIVGEAEVSKWKTHKIAVYFVAPQVAWLLDFFPPCKQAACVCCGNVLEGLFSPDGMQIFASWGRIFQRRQFICVFLSRFCEIQLCWGPVLVWWTRLQLKGRGYRLTTGHENLKAPSWMCPEWSCLMCSVLQIVT